MAKISTAARSTRSTYVAVKPYGARPSKIMTLETIREEFGIKNKNMVDMGKFTCKHNVPYQGLMLMSPTTMLCQNLKNPQEFRIWDRSALTKVEG